MNIIYIHTHDSGRLWSPYGFNTPTPNLMEMAKRSTLFRQCYDCAPTCSPSRAALLTGSYPHQNGMLGLAHRGFVLNDYSHHIACYLQRYGFYSVLCGIQHVAPDPKMIGYDAIIGKTQDFYHGLNTNMDVWDNDNTNTVCQFLAHYDQTKPLFASIGFFSTHRPFPNDDKSIDPRFISVPSPLYDNAIDREDMAGFHRSVKVFDTNFGKILTTLETAGYLKNSIILVTTDHGPAFPWMKGNLYDAGTGVGCMLYYPDNASNGTASDALISQIDIYPTLCELVGVPIPPWCEGKSIVPLLKNKTGKIRDAVYAETNFHAAYEPARSIRTERYRLIVRMDRHFHSPVLANIDSSSSKTFLLAYGLRTYPYDDQSLFDLYMDPNERNNLAYLDSYQTIKESLLSRLFDWMKQTDDPLLRGPLRRPRGAIINTQSCEDPEEPEFEKQ